MVHSLLVSAALALGQTGGVVPSPQSGPQFVAPTPPVEGEPVFTVPVQVPPATKETPVVPLEINAPILPPPPPPPPASATSPSAAPDRWAVMRELQGTWPGFLLDGNRLQVSGWTD